MTTAFNILAALVIAALSMGAAPTQKPLIDIRNGSMEEVAPGQTLPVGYYRWGDSLAAVDRTVTFEGKPSVKVLLRGTRESAGIVQQPASTVPEGKICRFRVRVRTHRLDGHVQLIIFRYPMPDTEYQELQPPQRLSGTNDWTILEALVPAKKGGDSFQVRMMVEGTTGRAWFANFEATVEDKR
jgi:hypothetical protein